MRVEGRLCANPESFCSVHGLVVSEAVAISWRCKRYPSAEGAKASEEVRVGMETCNENCLKCCAEFEMELAFQQIWQRQAEVSPRRDCKLHVNVTWVMGGLVD